MLSARPIVVLNGGETVLPCYPETFCEPVPGSVTAFAFLLGQDAIDLSGRACPIIRRYNRACKEDQTASAAGLTRSLTPYPSVAAPAGPFSAPKVRAIPTGSQAEIVRQLVPDPVRHLVEVLLTVVVELFLRGRAVRGRVTPQMISVSPVILSSLHRRNPPNTERSPPVSHQSRTTYPGAAETRYTWYVTAPAIGAATPGG